MRVLRFVTPVLMMSTSLFAEAPKLGGLFRGELMYNTNKSMETATTKSGSLSTVGQSAYAAFTANGMIADKVKLDSEVQFITALPTGKSGLPANCMGSPVRTALVTWMPMDMYSVGIGCSKVKSGGWDFAKYNESQTIHLFNPANSVNAGNPAFSYVPGEASFNPSIELGLHMIGDLTLQLMNDVIQANQGWNSKTNQTWNLEWKGEIFGVSPILQYGSYDQGHSSHFDVGFMTEVAGLGITFDYMLIENSKKTPKADFSGAVSKLDRGTRFSFELCYEIKNLVTPSFYFSSYMNKLNSKDPAANSAPGVWDHEGQVMGLSFAVNNMGNYSPYISFDTQEGRFLMTAAGPKKTRSDFIARIGAVAHF